MVFKPKSILLQWYTLEEIYGLTGCVCWGGYGCATACSHGVKTIIKSLFNNYKGKFEIPVHVILSSVCRQNPANLYAHMKHMQRKLIAKNVQTVIFSIPINVLFHICSSEEEAGNPLVAGFQDDLDPDDVVPITATSDLASDVVASNKNETPSSPSDSEEDETVRTISVQSVEKSLSTGPSDASFCIVPPENKDTSVDFLGGPDALDTWLNSSKWRNSPDGEEAGVGVTSEEDTRTKDEEFVTVPSKVKLDLPDLKFGQNSVSSGSESPVPATKEKKKEKHRDKVVHN